MLGEMSECFGLRWIGSWPWQTEVTKAVWVSDRARDHSRILANMKEEEEPITKPRPNDSRCWKICLKLTPMRKDWESSTIKLESKAIRRRKGNIRKNCANWIDVRNRRFGQAEERAISLPEFTGDVAVDFLVSWLCADETRPAEDAGCPVLIQHWYELKQEYSGHVQVLACSGKDKNTWIHTR